MHGSIFLYSLDYSITVMYTLMMQVFEICTHKLTQAQAKKDLPDINHCFMLCVY